MKKHSRLLALLLALVMVTAMFTACTNNGDDPDSTTPAPQSDTTAPGPDVTTDPNQTTQGTTVDLTGYEFTITGTNDVFPETDENGVYINATEQQLADELADLEERLGITITYQDFSGDKLEVLTTAMLANTKVADIIWAHVEVLWPLAKMGGILPYDEGTLADLGVNWQDETRWFVPTTEWTSMFGNVWGLNVASEYVAVKTGYFVQTNKEICAAAGYPDLYQMVRDKEWTWEVYRDIAKKSTKDLDGDGIYDQWGTSATAWGNEVMSNGVQYVDEVDGKWTVSIDSQEGIRALQFLYDINFGDATHNLTVSNSDNRQLFCDGYAAFNMSDMGRINGPTQQCFNTNHPYGIVPIPLGPDATEYASGHNDLDGWAIQACNKDLEKVVPILNEWALIVNDTNAYLDVLNDGRCHTEEDKEMMIEYIIPNFALNYATATPDIWSAVDDNDEGGGLINDVSYNGMTPQQAIETNKNVIQAVLDSFFNK